MARSAVARWWLVPSLALVLAACPGDKPRPPAAAALPADTAPANLESLSVAIPPAVVESEPGAPGARRGTRRAARRYPPPPAALLAAVRREQAFSRFCYQEYGQKSDPTLAGGVAVKVTVAAAGVSEARVADDTWSSPAGAAVNRCLDERAKSAWKLAAGAVRPGTYIVQLAFQPS